jgi:NhaP-type Na+/H+ or K+/H+ antiporter
MRSSHFASQAVLQETLHRADTTRVTPRLRVGAVLVGLCVGVLGLWLAGSLGASFGVQVLALMTATYTGIWAAILAGQLLLRRSRKAGPEGN